MSDAVIFGIVFVAFFVLRFIAATIFFLYILPEGVACPNCDAPTLRIQSKGWNFMLPRFRTSWCPGCGWEGLLRAQRAPTWTRSQSGQLPVISKKSSK